MNEENDKSLEDQLKEAQLEKIKAETADVRKRLKQVRVLGVPLVQIIFGGIVVGFILLSYIQPIVTLDTDLASKKSEYDKIIGWIERVKLDSINITLTKERMNLIKDKKRQDSTNIALTKMAVDLQVESQNAEKKLLVLQLEKVKRQSEIDSLDEKLKKAIVSFRKLSGYNDIEEAFAYAYPEVKTSVRVGEVPVEGIPNVYLTYLLIPIGFADVFLTEHENSNYYKLQKDKIKNLDLLEYEISALKDTILALRGQNK